MRGGSYDGLLLVWTLGNSSGKVRVQRGSRSRVLLIPRAFSPNVNKKVTRSGSQAHRSYLSTRLIRGPAVPSGYGPDTLGPASACLRAARRSEPSQGSPPFDISRITQFYASSPKYPTSIAQRGIRVGWVGETHLTKYPGNWSLTPGPNWLRV